MVLLHAVRETLVRFLRPQTRNLDGIMKRTILFLLFLFFIISAKAEISFSTLSFPEDSTYIDLADTVITDFDSFEAFLDQFPSLSRVDMWETPMTRNLCDRLASRYPAVRWGWTMMIKCKGTNHIIRTDDTSFSTLHNNRSPGHTAEEFEILKYCWDLKALDIGHNKVDRLDWLVSFPDLRVLIVACNHITDISPLAGLKHLEYAELFKNEIRDITPLRGLTHLMDLNLSLNKIDDLSVLKEMPWLKRLWIYSCRYIHKEPPREVVKDLQAALPDTYIDYTHYSTGGRWRYLVNGDPHPHYKIILEIFGKDHQHPAHQYIPFEDSYPE